MSRRLRDSSSVRQPMDRLGAFTMPCGADDSLNNALWLFFLGLCFGYGRALKRSAASFGQAAC